MEYVMSYRELEVYTLSGKAIREIFEVSKRFPKEEMLSLTDYRLLITGYLFYSSLFRLGIESDT